MSGMSEEKKPTSVANHDALIREAREIALDPADLRQSRAERLTDTLEGYERVLTHDPLYQRAQAFLEKTKEGA
jgi:hypothetical protein